MMKNIVRSEFKKNMWIVMKNNTSQNFYMTARRALQMLTQPTDTKVKNELNEHSGKASH